MMTTQTGFGEFRRGWPIVLSALLGIGLGLSPLPFYTTGVFAPHLAKAFGWTIGQIMGGISVTTVMVLWAGPAVGMLAGRYGPRRVAITSTILFSFAFMGFALQTGALWFYYLTWAVVTVTGAGSLPITWTRAITNWFDVRRGLALGIALMGTGIFGFLSKGLTTTLIAHYGWRGAYVGLGLLPLLIAVPAALLMFRDADTSGSRPAVVSTVGLTTRETLRDWRFWLIAIALLPISFALAGPIPNMENILKSNGIDPASVLHLTPFIGLSALTGRLAGGWLLDRVWAPAAGFVILVTPALSCWLLSRGGLTFDGALISILLIGFAVGVEFDLMAFLVSRYFGLRSYTTIYGILYVFFSVGAGLAPMVFGRSFDASGSYNGILMISATLLTGGAAALLLLGRYPKFDLGAAPVGQLFPNGLLSDSSSQHLSGA